MARNDTSHSYNLSDQVYKGITLRLINRTYKRGLDEMKAKRYLLIPPANAKDPMTNQNVWIPNKHLEDNGTIKPDQDIDYVFRRAQRQLELAGYTEAIPGIKRRIEVKYTIHS